MSHELTSLPQDSHSHASPNPVMGLKPPQIDAASKICCFTIFRSLKSLAESRYYFRLFRRRRDLRSNMVMFNCLQHRVNCLNENIVAPSRDRSRRRTVNTVCQRFSHNCSTKSRLSDTEKKTRNRTGIQDDRGSMTGSRDVDILFCLRVGVTTSVLHFLATDII